MLTHIPLTENSEMTSAPMKYLPTGEVDWGTMWNTFCKLASEDGGRPHRGEMMRVAPITTEASEAYEAVVAELVRGIKAVSNLPALPAEPGWVAVVCESSGMARWLSEAILQENVPARHTGHLLLVPAAANFTLKNEIKSVITVVAKTTHYWANHLPAEAKTALVWEARIANFLERLKSWRRQTSG